MGVNPGSKLFKKVLGCELPPAGAAAGAHSRAPPKRAREQPADAQRAGTTPPPSRTKWTRRVPHPVLIGHAASLTPY